MQWSELNLPVSMQGKSREIKNIYIAAANKSFEKFQDEQAALFAASQAVSIEERKLANGKRKVKPPSVPLHLKAVLDASKKVDEPTQKQNVIQQAFLPKNSLQVGVDRSLVSADFDNNGRLVLTFDTGETIVTTEVAVKEYIEQYVSVAPSTQILSSDGSILIDQVNQIFDLSTGPVINPLDHLDFNQLTPSTGAVGRLRWNNTDGTLEVGLKGGNVTLQIGQEEVVHILNNTNAAFTDLQVIRITGASGQRMTGALAQANGETTSSATFAVVTELIAKNQVGFATVSGLVRDVNTSSFPEGAALWLSPNIAGGITHIKPVAPSHLVLIGWCVRSHQINGSIYVNIQNGYELDELHNVLINGVTNDQVLAYESSSGLWKNKTITAGSTYSAGTDLSLAGTVFNHTTSGIPAGTYTKITVNDRGHATSGQSLNSSDIPPLDASKITSGIFDSARLPSFVDDVLEYPNLAGFPVTGESGKIYVALDTNKTYRWSGSVYIYITSGAVDSVAGKTGVVTLVKSDVGLSNVDNTSDSSKNVLSATKLSNARTITLEGDVSGSVSFDGSSNVGLVVNAKTGSYFSKINTSASVTYVITHNLGLIDKDAFTLNAMLNGSQVQVDVSSVNINSLTITTSVNTVDLAITIIGIKS